MQCLSAPFPRRASRERETLPATVHSIHEEDERGADSSKHSALEK